MTAEAPMRLSEAPMRKVQAGGIIRTALDNSWQTPPKIAVPARSYFPGGAIPFDAATALSNPMQAERFCVGRLNEVAPLLVPRRLRNKLGRLVTKLVPEPEARTRRRGLERRRSLLAFAAMGAELANPTFWGGDLSSDGFPFGTPPGCDPSVPHPDWLELLAAERAGAMPFCSGLDVDWKWPTWVNPPYGRELKKWLAKIASEGARRTEIVGLLPCARWEQRYFHKVLREADRILFIRSRVAFVSSIDGEEVGGNPYANMLVGWNTSANRWLDAFGALGYSVDVKTTTRRRVARLEPANAGGFAESLFGGFIAGGLG